MFELTENHRYYVCGKYRGFGPLVTAKSVR